MRRLNLLFTLTLIAFGACQSARAQSGCRYEGIPAQAQLLITKKFPGWRVKLTSDLADYDKELWSKEHRIECPGITVGYFEHPDQKAYGLLLVPKSGAETGYKIVVVAKSGPADTYSLRMLDHAEEQRGSGDGLVISTVPPGTYPGFDTSESVHLKQDALEVEWLEKSSVLYYWRNGRYQTLQTSD